MGIINLISALDSSELRFDDRRLTVGFDLAPHESQTLKAFVSELKYNEADIKCFNGYFISYTIKQISKEFDLLRFGQNSVINIELKANLSNSIRDSKITRQMSQNHYYLRFLNLDVDIYTFIEGDGLYHWDNNVGIPVKVDITHLLVKLSKQIIDFNVNPDNLFIPKNYLISTFNDTENFLNGEYFLTDHQLNIKKEILDCIDKNMYKVFCISANAGTGKTLLAYDIAKELMNWSLKTFVIHCGKLNEGHRMLQSCGWKVIPIRNIQAQVVNCWNKEIVDIIIIDESHRIKNNQLDLIISKSIELNIPLIFMYDIKQFLRPQETKDVYKYIVKYYQMIPAVKKTLSNKIRTNKEMASFINNLMHIGSSRNDLNYDSVSVEYFEEYEDVKSYIEYLVDNEGWKAITFSNSLHYVDPLDTIASLCESNAHDVIGQEFDKVVFVMDDNFRYRNNTSLETRESYYSASGMLYQIVTRVVLELKIIVLNNAELFSDLLRIKHCIFISDN